MSWAFSFELVPGEEIVEDSSKDQSQLIRHDSVLITNRRVIFRFDGLGSLLKKSFFYRDILDAKPITRFNISYLFIMAGGREYFFNISEPAAWSQKILLARDAYTNQLR